MMTKLKSSLKWTVFNFCIQLCLWYFTDKKKAAQCVTGLLSLAGLKIPYIRIHGMCMVQFVVQSTFWKAVKVEKLFCMIIYLLSGHAFFVWGGVKYDFHFSIFFVKVWRDKVYFCIKPHIIKILHLEVEHIFCYSTFILLK